MKVLIILNDLKNGGVERVLSVLSNHMADHGFDVFVLAIASENISYSLSQKIHYEYVPIIRIYQKNNIFKEIRTLKCIYHQIKRINPDCVIGFDDSIIIRSIPSAWLLRKKILISERIDPSIYGLPMRLIRQISYDMADRVVFQTKDAMNYFPKRTRKKSVVIPNPITENLPLRSNFVNTDIIMACRLRAQKNVALAIDAFSIFYKTHPSYRLVVYGEGEQLNELKASAKSKGVSEAVLFPGHVDDIHERMRSCAMYLSTSDYEGISNSMLEALAIGAPTICTDCPVGGARMFIESGVNGVLTPVGDAVAVYKAMESIADNPEYAKKLSEESIKIRHKLCSNVICPQWEALL